MSLHEDQKQRIMQWLTSNVAAHCPVCSTLDCWEVHDSIYGLPSLALDTVNLQKGLELIAATCKKCGHTALFMAKRIGV
jgi:hypothetical protein